MDDSGIEMIAIAMLDSRPDWSMASTRPVADLVRAMPVMYEDSIDAREKPMKLSKGKRGNPKWMKPTTSSFIEDLCSHHDSKGALCFVPICRCCA